MPTSSRTSTYTRPSPETALTAKLWTFTSEGFVGFTPSHLREHQILALPVTVSYRETADGLVAVSVTD